MQPAVEGRFCDSAISVREAALELVGRHIASHPDVGLKVCLIDLFSYWVLGGCLFKHFPSPFPLFSFSILRRLRRES